MTDEHNYIMYIYIYIYYIHSNYIYIYIYMCVCVRVYVGGLIEGKHQPDKDIWKGRQGERERD